MTPNLSHTTVQIALQQDENIEDEEYSPPPTSAYGNESSAESDHVMGPAYSSRSGENGSEEDLGEEIASNNKGWL
ncbi:MAG: hypothetical protein M1813_002182 [Trichoglossum hirsutum]|nr:MAG: hypothetical protein M1813_002182 [Trichoglossum hirsutum]